jgi:excisionase family DNA binding protein
MSDILARPLPLRTVAELATALHVSPRAVRRWIAEGRLPTVRFGRAVRIRPHDVERIQQTGLPR